MTAALATYFTTICALLAAGVSATAAARPSGRWLGLATLPIGAAVLLVLLYPLGYFMPTRAATPVVAGILLAAFLVGITRRRRLRSRDSAITPVRVALKPSASTLSILAWGATAGGIFLWPLLKMNVATTAAVSVFDGWARAVFSEWVYRNPTGSAEFALQTTQPLGSYSSPPDALAMGLEHLSAFVMTLTDQPSFKVVAAVAAVSGPLATSGLALMANRLGANVTPLTAPLFALAATAPPAAFLFADNYFTQLLSVSLVPFAAASAIDLGRNRNLTRVLTLAVGMAAVIGTYPPMTPWLFSVVLVSFLIGAQPRTRQDIGKTLGALSALTVTLAVLAPLQLHRAYASITTVSGLRSNEAFPLFGPLHQAEVAVGARTPFSLKPFDLTSVVMPTSVVLVIVLTAVAAAFLAQRRDTALSVVALFAAIAAPTFALVWRYGVVDQYGYGVIKAVASGATLFLGMTIVALCLPARSDHAFVYRTALATACVLLWLPVSLQTTNLIVDRDIGFRDDDVAAHKRVQALPQGAAVLFEGISRSLTPFQTRAITAYFERFYAHVRLSGQGTAPTYMTDGGAPEWQPSSPWRFVIMSEPPFVTTARRVLWSNDSYTILEAPAFDITPYGSGWQGIDDREPEQAVGLAEGDASFVVSNRTAAPGHVEITANVGNTSEVNVRLTVTIGATTRRFTLAAGSLTRLVARGAVGAHSTTLVSVRPTSLGRAADDGSPPGARAPLEYGQVSVSPVPSSTRTRVRG